MYIYAIPNGCVMAMGLVFCPTQIAAGSCQFEADQQATGHGWARLSGGDVPSAGPKNNEENSPVEVTGW